MTLHDSAPETQEHIDRVGDFMTMVIDNLDRRARVHDRSKLEAPEKDTWDEVTPKLAELEYGTDEYRASLRAIRPTLKHHYAHNSHHPEHYGDDGVNGMSLLDLLEMLCDWRAASERTKQRTDDPNKVKTFSDGLQYNFDRYGIDPQLQSILYNTVKELGL